MRILGHPGQRLYQTASAAPPTSPGRDMVVRAMTRVLIVAGVRFYREGLRKVLPSFEGFEVVGAVASSEQSVQAALSTDPDVVLIDDAVEGSLDLVRELRRALVDVRVVAIGVTDDADDVLEWAEAGVSAYASRDASLDDLVQTMRNAMRGRLKCSPRVASALFERLHRRSTSTGRKRRTRRKIERLTPRETQVVALLRRGMSNKRIATTLGISVATVKNHVHRVLQKLDLSRRSEVAAGLWQEDGEGEI